MTTAYARKNQILFLLAVTLLLFALCSYHIDFFFTKNNFQNIIESLSYRMILAIGMTFVIASGAMDLSVGSLFSLAGIASALALKSGFTAGTSIVFAIFVSISVGCINGLIIDLTKINFFIITLASSAVLRGIALIVTQGKPITGFSQAFLQIGIGRILGIQIPVWIMFFILAMSVVLLNITKWGSYVLSIGGNEEALRKVGVPVLPYKMSVFAFMGFCCALSALIMTARLNSAEPNAGMGMELEAITAVIMGGSRINGGSAGIAGTALAIFILSIIRNALTLLGISSDYQHLITGILLFVSVLISSPNVYKAKALYKKITRRKNV